MNAKQCAFLNGPGYFDPPPPATDASQVLNYFCNMHFLDELNEQQRKAVMATDGPVLIVAGPGSGKTRVLTYRIAYLMQQGVDPFRILALTFTNKAAREMRDRVERLCGAEARNLYIGTFHSVFARILRREAHRLGFPSHFTIYDTDDSRSLLKTIIRENALNDQIYKPNVVHQRISAAKNSLIGPEQYQRDIQITADDAASGRPHLGKLYEQYVQRCFMAGAMDFDDLLYRMYCLLSQFPDVLYHYQHRFLHILIDEFQDTNHAQYAIVRKLGDVHQNLCVVGDDAQSIYSFRGATVGNILHFEQDYPDLQLFKLEQNYRSTQYIVRAANQVIRNNRQQIAKHIWTANPLGERIRLIPALSDSDEARQVVDQLFEERMNQKRNFRDFVILYRTHAQSRSLEEALRRVNIPYMVFGGVSFYQRKEIKDVLAYLRLTVNPYDEESLRRIINYPARGIGTATLEKAAVIAHEHHMPLWDVLAGCRQWMPGHRSNPSVEEFVNKIKNFQLLAQTHDAYEVAVHVIKASGLLDELYEDKSVEGISRYENVQELLNGIKEFTAQSAQPVLPTDPSTAEDATIDRSLAAYLQEITLLTDVDEERDQGDRVYLMTIHSAKGLEFPCVFIVGLEENLFPNILSLSSREELEEERRLFYVAITRAQEKLFFSFAASRYRFGQLQYNRPSRFLDEIDAEVLDRPLDTVATAGKSMNMPGVPLRAISHQASVPQHTPEPDFVPDDYQQIETGMQVEHPRFGYGTVIQLDGSARDRIATVAFQKGVGEKKIMLRYARLRIVRSADMPEPPSSSKA